MGRKEIMPLQEQATVSSACLAPPPSTRTGVGLAGHYHPAPVGRARTLEDEISYFILRHVLEQDAQFFDG
jgi:hypothetical protein